LDAGDLLCSKKVDPSLSSLQQKEAVLSAKLIVDAFSLMGCDAVGIGEDDLRLGAKDFAKVRKLAGFSFISANVVTRRGRQVSVPSVIKEAGGARGGIFSLMSAHPSLKDQNRDWKVLDPVSTGIHVVKELQGKADIIILLAAMPLEELRALLPQVGGITIAVAGDNPSGLRKALQVGQTVVVSSYAYGRYLGVLTLSLGDLTAPLIDEARITQLERELAGEAGKTKGGASAEVKQKMEADLEELKRGNSYRNELIMLSSRFQEDPAVQKLIADFSEQQKKLNTGCSVR
jgi:2',3'-cyclic-nucleotide 2'-phosphodiesterase (5'-nucleotidase family)